MFLKSCPIGERPAIHLQAGAHTGTVIVGGVRDAKGSCSILDAGRSCLDTRCQLRFRSRACCEGGSSVSRSVAFTYRPPELRGELGYRGKRVQKTRSLRRNGKPLYRPRAPLGAMKSRTPKSATSTTTLPGAPGGEYVVFQFTTSFEQKPAAVETVTAVGKRRHLARWGILHQLRRKALDVVVALAGADEYHVKRGRPSGLRCGSKSRWSWQSSRSGTSSSGTSKEDTKVASGPEGPGVRRTHRWRSRPLLPGMGHGRSCLGGDPVRGDPHVVASEARH